MFIVRLALLFSAVLLLAACPDEQPHHALDAGPLTWESCPLFSDDPASRAAECASVEAPLRWDRADGETITLFVKRLRGTVEPTRQLWLLNGGPGGPGADFEVLAEYLASVAPDVDVYLPDHRGTGLSTHLGCPVQEHDDSPGGIQILSSEWPACRDSVLDQWGDGLAGFSTTNAAEDLAWLIERTREPGKDVELYAGSYGTLWAQRFLRLHPDEADAVLLFGIAPPTLSFVDYDATFDRVGRDYLAVCGADPVCSEKLDQDPAFVAEVLFERLEQGLCPAVAAEGLDRHTLRRLFATIMFFSWYERALVPAMIYRLDRCMPDDVAALRVLARQLLAPRAPTIYDRLQSQVLGMHIGLSELWQDPMPDPIVLNEIDDGALFSLGVGPHRAQIQDSWPRYQPDEHDGQWAATPAIMLMMNGSLDPATPLSGAELVGEHFAGANQTFVTIPGANHSLRAPTTDNSDCVLSLFVAFVRDPSAPRDTSCIDKIVPLDFAGTPALSMAAFGTADLWENTVAARGLSAAEVEGARAALAKIKRRAWTPGPR